MPSLSIPFPEGTRTVALRGNNITIGRLPDNVIQIRDRAVSAYHAELVVEGNHYRIHDRSSTNGIIIGGQVVSDYHLHEDCQVILGGLSCEYSAAPVPEPTPTDMDKLATRGEMHTVLQTNASLQKQVESLQQQVSAMTKAREAVPGDGPTVSMEQYDQLAADAATLRASLQERQTQIEKLSSLLAIAQRERDTLQKAYDDVRAALKDAQSTALAPAPAVAKLATPAPTPTPDELAQTVRLQTVAAPKPPAVSKPAIPKPVAPLAAPAPAAPAPATAVTPTSLPKPPSTIGTGSPSRRPASGVVPAKTSGGAAALVAAAASGLKATQKIAE